MASMIYFLIRFSVWVMIKCIPTQAEGLLVFCRLVFVSLWSLSCLYLDYDKEIPNYDYLKKKVFC